MYRALSIVTALWLCACAAPTRQVSPPSAPTFVEPPVQVIRDPQLVHQAKELERQVTQLELQLMERDALNEALNLRLERALQEVVGAMAKLRSLATRAEAASAMAEADVALQAVKKSGSDSPELRRAFRLMQQSSAEFKRRNFGGALYLANQAKMAARLGRSRDGVANMRLGEVEFAVPVKLRASTRANVRIGPGVDFAVSSTVESGSALSGLSYLGEWVRVTGDAGIEGWIFGPLVGRREN